MSKQLNWSDLAEKETKYSLLYGGMSISRVIIDDYVEIAPLTKKKQVPFYQTLNKYPKFVRK